MACIDDVILDDDESEAALTHVPAGRDALLILPVQLVRLQLSASDLQMMQLPVSSDTVVRIK